MIYSLKKLKILEKAFIFKVLYAIDVSVADLKKKKKIFMCRQSCVVRIVHFELAAAAIY